LPEYLNETTGILRTNAGTGFYYGQLG